MVVTGIILALSILALAGNAYQPLSSFNAMMFFMGTKGQIATAILSGGFFIVTTIAYLKQRRAQNLAERTMQGFIEDLKHAENVRKEEIRDLKEQIQTLTEKTQSLIDEQSKSTTKLIEEQKKETTQFLVQAAEADLKLQKELKKTTNATGNQIELLKSEVQKIQESKDAEKEYLKTHVLALSTAHEHLKGRIHTLETTPKRVENISSTNQDKTETTDASLTPVQRSEIDRFSDEIFLNIFLFLNAPELNTCALVSKRWNHLTNDNAVWKERCVRYILLDLPLSEGVSRKQEYIQHYQNRDLEKTFNHDYKSHPLPETSHIFSAFGSQLVTVSSDDVIKIWDLQTLKIIGQLSPGIKEISSLYTTEEGLCAIGSETGTIEIYDLNALKFLGKIEEKDFRLTKLYIHQHRLCAALSQKLDESTLLKQIVVVDLNSEKELHRFVLPYYDTNEVSFLHCQGDILTVGSSRVIQVWDLSHDALYCEIHCPNGKFSEGFDEEFFIPTSEADGDQLFSGYRPWINAHVQNGFLYTYDTEDCFKWNLNEIKTLFYGKILMINEYHCDDGNSFRIFDPLPSSNVKSTSLDFLDSTLSLINKYRSYYKNFKICLYDYESMNWLQFAVSKVSYWMKLDAQLDVKGNLMLVHNKQQLTIFHRSTTLEKREISLEDIAGTQVSSIKSAKISGNTVMCQSNDDIIHVLKFSIPI